MCAGSLASHRVIGKPTTVKHHPGSTIFNLMFTDRPGRFFVDSVLPFDYTPRFDFKRTHFFDIKVFKSC